VSAVVEVRMLAETLVLTPHLALASMGPWQVLRRSSRRKVASLVHVYTSDARLIITRGIYSSTSRAPCKLYKRFSLTSRLLLSLCP